MSVFENHALVKGLPKSPRCTIMFSVDYADTFISYMSKIFKMKYSKKVFSYSTKECTQQIFNNHLSTYYRSQR